MRIAYCARCSPPVVVAAGPIPDGGACSHRAGGEVHPASLADVPDSPRREKETLGAYLKRLAAENAAALG